MSNGMTIKIRGEESSYDIHLNGTACSGYTYYKGSTGPISNLFKSFFKEPYCTGSWSKDTYERYKQGHTVIMPMCFVRWENDSE